MKWKSKSKSSIYEKKTFLVECRFDYFSSIGGLAAIAEHVRDFIAPHKIVTCGEQLKVGKGEGMGPAFKAAAFSGENA